MSTRVLFLDDSGKPDVGHAATHVVIAGFSISSRDVATLSRRLLGAKGRYFPNRKDPAAWEIKSSQFIKPNPWNRGENRDFVFEVVRIVTALDGTFYSASIDKSKMNHPMTLAATTPMLIQALIEHFEVECRIKKQTGLMVADWSSKHSDEHASRCVASFVGSKKFNMHPSVYYASSMTCQATQVCDLIAGLRRRVLSGDRNLHQLDQQIAPPLTWSSPGLRTVDGRPFRRHVELF